MSPLSVAIWGTILAAVLAFAMPLEARPAQHVVGAPHEIARQIDERSWLQAPGRPVPGYQAHPGFVSRPDGMQWHPGAIHNGGR